MPEDLEIALDQLAGDIAAVELDAIPEAFCRSTECDQMIIREDGVSFFCYPKHSSVEITTPELAIDLIHQFLNETNPEELAAAREALIAGKLTVSFEKSTS